MPHAPIGIIGAGPAGLALGAALRARGLEFEILDAGRGPGGIWDIDRPDTPMYESAHFISSKSLSGFPGFPMPDAYPDYPRHDQVLAYLREFAAHHDLQRHTRFGVTVARAHREPGSGPDPAPRWTVALDDGDERSYAALCLATGANWHPVIPDLPGTFSGEAIHSFEYRSPDLFRGRRVLIVGAGNSGCDIACDAARAARRAFVSVRRGYHFVPKYVFGKPADVFAHEGPALPAWLERRVFSFLIRRLLVGDVTRFGLPRPDHDVLESHPIMNTRMLHHLGHGDLEARPDVTELDGSRVRFADGSTEEIDLIVWATGYRRIHPFLEAADLDERNGALDFYLNVAHRRYDDLFEMGLFETDGAAYPLLGLQADLVAAVLDPALPASRRADWQARRATARPDVRGGRRYLDTPRHALYVHGASYEKLLRRELSRLSG